MARSDLRTSTESPGPAGALSFVVVLRGGPAWWFRGGARRPIAVPGHPGYDEILKQPVPGPRDPVSPELRSPMRYPPAVNERLRSLLIAAAVVISAGASGAEAPRLGSPADLILDQGREAHIGRSIYFRLIESDQLLSDPILDDYVQDVGDRVSAQAQRPDHGFTFFVVPDGRINAFALPGGYIGVNSGLITTTENESELASVLAHETAHVTQRHIASRLGYNRNVDLTSLAVMLAGIIIGSQTEDPDVAPGIIMAGQAAALQQKINYTRDMEYEADRVGMGFLADAGYRPDAMADFFQTVGQRERMVSTGELPEILRTHPVSATRTAEARGRAAQLRGSEVRESRLYGFMKERARVLTNERSQELVRAYRDSARDGSEAGEAARRYGLALALARSGRPDEAAGIFAQLLDQYDGVIAFHIDLGRAQIEAGRDAEGMVTLRNAVQLFPRHRPATLAYADALIAQARHPEAHDILLDLLNNVRPRPPEVKKLARVANESGRLGDARHYMAEYHLMTGDLKLAIRQLRQAVDTEGIDRYQRARYEARLEEIIRAIPEEDREDILKDI